MALPAVQQASARKACLWSYRGRPSPALHRYSLLSDVTSTDAPSASSHSGLRYLLLAQRRCVYGTMGRRSEAWRRDIHERGREGVRGRLGGERPAGLRGEKEDVLISCTCFLHYIRPLASSSTLFCTCILLSDNKAYPSLTRTCVCVCACVCLQLRCDLRKSKPAPVFEAFKLMAL